MDVRSVRRGPLRCAPSFKPYPMHPQPSTLSGTLVPMSPAAFPYVLVAPGKLAPVRADAQWNDIAKGLLSDIREGRLEVGARVPSIADLAEKHQVARKTAQKAIAHLRELGVVTSRPSSGTWVAALPVDDDLPPSVARTILGRLDEHDEALAELRARLERLERGE